jgi:glycerol 3-phosphatase-2
MSELPGTVPPSPPAGPSMLGRCADPLWTAYDVAMLDLDGVVYIGAHAVPGADRHLERAVAAGMKLAFVTNNAARTPTTVAAHLSALGIPAAPEDVVTSAQAAARLVVEAVGPGAAVFVIGGEGLIEALAEHDVVGVQSLDDAPVAVVSGYHPDLRWRTVIDGAILVRQGLPWFVSNTDRTVPTPHGPGPGNGVLVGAVADFAGLSPVVAGKPEPPLFHETQRRVGGRRPLVVGDRLDTDIEGAVRAGYDSLLVMTGVTGLVELVSAPAHTRPTYVAATLDGLGHPHLQPQRDGSAWRQEGWVASVTDGILTVSGTGAADSRWQVVASAAWSHLDATGTPVATEGLSALSS